MDLFQLVQATPHAGEVHSGPGSGMRVCRVYVCASMGPTSFYFWRAANSFIKSEEIGSVCVPWHDVCVGCRFVCSTKKGQICRVNGSCCSNDMSIIIE